MDLYTFRNFVYVFYFTILLIFLCVNWKVMLSIVCMPTAEIPIGFIVGVFATVVYLVHGP